MQETLKVPHKSFTLRRLLDRNSGPITASQRKTILNAMSALSSLHGFPAGTWKTAIIQDDKYRWCNEELLDYLISLRSNIDQQHYPFALLKRPFYIGLLHVPIGDIFAMNASSRRMDALQWMCGTITNFKSEDDPNNLALFHFTGTINTKMQLLWRSLG